MTENTWDTRYSGDDYLFGTAPAAFLTAQSEYLLPGRALAVADGEGRNSVFLAQQGLDVTAFDASSIAVEKARRLAEVSNVKIDYLAADIQEWKWQEEAFDCVIAVFIQFAPPNERDVIFAGMKRTLRPGGTLLLHGYRPEQLGYGTGGPPHVENMYTTNMLRSAFGDMEILRLAAYDQKIVEGRGHHGMSALIDLIARKPL